MPTILKTSFNEALNLFGLYMLLYSIFDKTESQLWYFLVAFSTSIIINIAKSKRKENERN